MKKFLSIVLAVLIGFGPEASYAQQFVLSQLPLPGAPVALSSAFEPVLVKGMVIYPKEPLKFRFIVDSGTARADDSAIKEESTRIMKYFLAAVTVPEKDQWVNLSPYEHERMITDELGGTDLGRDMLAQDYVLKQLTASMMNPDQGVGKEFWTRVYAEAQAKFGTTDIPVDTFNKVWIMPDKAEVFERGNAVYVTKAHLKVMLDSDYQAMSQSAVIPSPKGEESQNTQADLTKQILREVMLPAIEREINEGANFSTVRQIYYAGILARWYRDTIKNSLMADAYMDKAKTAGVDLDDKTLKEQIYQRYIEAYKKGVVNFIREESSPATGEVIPRKYFSGGMPKVMPDAAEITKTADTAAVPQKGVMTVDFAAATPDDAAQAGREAFDALIAQFKDSNFFLLVRTSSDQGSLTFSFGIPYFEQKHLDKLDQVLDGSGLKFNIAAGNNEDLYRFPIGEYSAQQVAQLLEILKNVETDAAMAKAKSGWELSGRPCSASGIRTRRREPGCF
jgi:hypothetical protein